MIYDQRESCSPAVHHTPRKLSDRTNRNGHALPIPSVLYRPARRLDAHVDLALRGGYRVNDWILVIVCADGVQLRMQVGHMSELIDPAGAAILVSVVAEALPLWRRPEHGGIVSCSIGLGCDMTPLKLFTAIRRHGLHHYRFTEEPDGKLRGHRFWIYAVVTYLEIYRYFKLDSGRDVKSLVQWIWWDHDIICPWPKPLVPGRFLVNDDGERALSPFLCS
ncbi:hypothetical protein CALCODRAFT_501123, partial [Calocera cornea HHB12733]